MDAGGKARKEAGGIDAELESAGTFKIGGEASGPGGITSGQSVFPSWLMVGLEDGKHDKMAQDLCRLWMASSETLQCLVVAG